MTAYVFYLKVSLHRWQRNRLTSSCPDQENSYQSQKISIVKKHSLVSTVWIPSRALFYNFNHLIFLEGNWRNCNYRYPQKILPHKPDFCILIHFSHVHLFVTLWTHVACQVYLSMRFSRQEYWSGLPCPSSTMTFS